MMSGTMVGSPLGNQMYGLGEVRVNEVFHILNVDLMEMVIRENTRGNKK